MRPRAEVICYTAEGVYAIDKGDYILFPGGGIDDGEQPRDGAIRETIEEANRHPINVTPSGVVESVWPKDSGNEFWDDSEFDGERTYFFLGLDSGEAGIKHDDQEDFQAMSFDKLKARLRELIDDEGQAWAKRNNEERLRLVGEAQSLATADPKPIKQAAANPYAPPKEDEEEEDKTPTWMRNLGIGLTAVGGLGSIATHTTPKWFLRPEHEQAVKDYVTAAKQRWTGAEVAPRQATKEYAELGSRAAAVQPFGFRMADFMEKIRKVPGISEIPWQGDISRQHYEKFGTGPLTGYLTRLAEHEYGTGFSWRGGHEAPEYGYQQLTDPNFSFVRTTDDPEDPSNFMVPADLDNPEGRAFLDEKLAKLREDVGISAGEQMPNPAGLANRLENYADDMARQMGYENPGVNLENIPPAEQKKLLDNFDEYVKKVDPKSWKAKQLSDFETGLHGVDRGHTYSVGVGRSVKTLDILRKAFPVALGAGGALMLGYLLHRLFRSDKKKEAKKAQAAPAPNTPPPQDPAAGGVPRDPNDEFVRQLAQRFKGVTQQTMQQPQPAPPSGPTPPGVIAEEAGQKIAESYIDFRDITDPEDREKMEAEVQAEVHGAPQAEDIIQHAQRDVLEKTAVIKEEDGKYKLYTRDGSRVLGTHDSYEKAAAQERAIQHSKAKKASDAENEGLEELEGGFADNIPGEKYDARELTEGTKIEMEHTDEGDKAVEIAKDHLEEISDYYTRLEDMEEDAKEDGHEKVADVVQLIPRQDQILFLPDGRIVVRRAENRRFRFPGEGPGRRAPYESDVMFIPESGVPQEGYHGFKISPRVGEIPDAPEGFEAVPPESVLRDLYASMGLAVNKPYRQLDRTRVRVINRWIKRRKKQKERERLYAEAPAG
jgi:8-oxo-dGTP pyrophosphatase MutT (NUDIX family)